MVRPKFELDSQDVCQGSGPVIMSHFAKMASRELQQSLSDLQSRLAEDAAVDRLKLDLEVHQLELEMQNRELRKALMDLEVSRDSYAELYDFAPVALLTLDCAGLIHEMNLAAGTLLGQKRPGQVGWSLLPLIALDDRRRVQEHLLRCARSECSDSLDLTLHVKGVTLPVRLVGRSRPHFNGDESVVRVALLDLTPLRLVEQEHAFLEQERSFRAQAEELAERTRQELACVESRTQEERTALLRRLVETQEEERRRIARELHDQLGQLLAGLTLGLKSLESDLAAGRQAEKLREMQTLANQMGQEIRELAFELRPAVLDDFGLPAALGNYVETWAKRTQTEVDFQCTGLDGLRLPTEVETALYRIVQEALTNITKHAKANHVSVVLKRRESRLVAIVEDNGQGFDVDRNVESSPSEGRMGLLGIRERLAPLGGSLEIESSPGQGTTVFVRVPLSTSDKSSYD